jgi:phage terminase large subunit-like protein
LTSSVKAKRPEAVPGYVYDQARPDRVIKFCETLCMMSKGEWAGKPIKLLDWQKRDIIEPLFGWHDDQGRRRYRTAAIYTPKKQGKSTLLSALAIYFLLGDGEPGAEVISAASDRAQAGIIAREAAAMVRASSSLSRVLEVMACGGSILMHRSPNEYKVGGMRKHFEPGHHFIEYALDVGVGTALQRRKCELHVGRLGNRVG